MSYVDKIRDKEQVEHDIQDARIPLPAEGDAGKVLKVSDALGFELGEGGGDEEDYILIPSSIGENSSLQDIIDLGIGIEMPTSFSANSYVVKFEGYYNIHTPIYFGSGLVQLDINYYGNLSIVFTVKDRVWNDKRSTYMASCVGTNKDTALKNYTESNQNIIYSMPAVVASLPNDASSKTYALQAVNGAIGWQEASGGSGNYIKVIDMSSLTYQSTYQDLLNLVGTTSDTIVYLFGTMTQGPEELTYFAEGLTKLYSLYGQYYIENTNKRGLYVARFNSVADALNTGTVQSIKPFVPIVTTLDTSKTYTLQCTNQTLSWVEEIA